MPKRERIIIIGAGPAGLGCASELTKKKVLLSGSNITILEKNNIVGGLARTYTYKNSHFDVGPHRFYTKNKEVLRLWRTTLGKEFIKVTRLTRIYYKGKLFFYPIQIKDVLFKLGFKESLLSLLSFIYSQIFLRSLRPITFEDWIVKNFGRKLYEIFFKTYTEKVWGIPCSQIGAEWASQRIKNLNFTEIIRKSLFKKRESRAKSLVHSFYYPSKGTGSMYEKLANNLQRRSVKIELKSEVVEIKHKNKKINLISYKKGGKRFTCSAETLFSSMPLTHFIQYLKPSPQKEVLAAAKKLYYRDHITVNLVVKGENLFQDNWIYVHSSEVKIARVANYNNFSDKMAKKGYTALSVEYFSFKEDEVWAKSDNELVSFAVSEMEKINLLHKSSVIDAFVVRETESYPTYYLGHKKYFDVLKSYAEQFENLYLIGRGGMYKYNNMDHSILSGMLSARNYFFGEKRYNLWLINEDAEYLENK